MNSSILADKSVSFAIRIVKLHQHLQQQREYVIPKQIVRSGTGIGANIHESQHAESPADFVSKLSIALKEATETYYWLKVLHGSGLIASAMFNSFEADVLELIRMLTSSLNTVKAGQREKRP